MSSLSILLYGAKRKLIKMAPRQVQVDGRVFQPLMAHHEVDDAQISSAFEQVRGEAMPEGMRAARMAAARQTFHTVLSEIGCSTSGALILLGNRRTQGFFQRRHSRRASSS